MVIGEGKAGAGAYAEAGENPKGNEPKAGVAGVAAEG